MKATLNDIMIAQSDDIVENSGYIYFPRAAVRAELLKKVPKTASDLRCPHGVQFYDVVVDGVSCERAAWAYELPLASKMETANRVGFWKGVKVG
jgi:uncharacterized protein (DUF427 family)